MQQSSALARTSSAHERSARLRLEREREEVEAETAADDGELQLALARIATLERSTPAAAAQQKLHAGALLRSSVAPACCSSRHTVQERRRNALPATEAASKNVSSGAFLGSYSCRKNIWELRGTSP